MWLCGTNFLSHVSVFFFSATPLPSLPLRSVCTRGLLQRGGWRCSFGIQLPSTFVFAASCLSALLSSFRCWLIIESSSNGICCTRQASLLELLHHLEQKKKDRVTVFTIQRSFYLAEQKEHICLLICNVSVT
jgi:hypothetical protein